MLLFSFSTTGFAGEKKKRISLKKICSCSIQAFSKEMVKDPVVKGVIKETVRTLKSDEFTSIKKMGVSVAKEYVISKVEAKLSKSDSKYAEVLFKMGDFVGCVMEKE